MSLPGDIMYDSFKAVVGGFLSPDDIDSGGKLYSYERGGVAISNPSQGLDLLDWRAEWVESTEEVRVFSLPSGTPTTLFTVSGLSELSLSFDQNMRPVVAYVASSQAFLYWYDPTIPAFTTTALATDVKSPILTLDDKRRTGTIENRNDALLFYIRGNAVYYRQQRDRYTVERKVATLSAPDAKIVRAGMSDVYRVQVAIRLNGGSIVGVP